MVSEDNPYVIQSYMMSEPSHNMASDTECVCVTAGSDEL